MYTRLFILPKKFPLHSLIIRGKNSKKEKYSDKIGKKSPKISKTVNPTPFIWVYTVIQECRVKGRDGRGMGSLGDHGLYGRSVWGPITRIMNYKKPL